MGEIKPNRITEWWLSSNLHHSGYSLLQLLTDLASTLLLWVFLLAVQLILKLPLVLVCCFIWPFCPRSRPADNFRFVRWFAWYPIIFVDNGDGLWKIRWLAWVLRRDTLGITLVRHRIWSPSVDVYSPKED
jgi:hypothetical protein